MWKLGTNQENYLRGQVCRFFFLRYKYLWCFSILHSRWQCHVIILYVYLSFLNQQSQLKKKTLKDGNFTSMGKIKFVTKSQSNMRCIFYQKILVCCTRGFAFTQVLSHKTRMHTRHWKLLLGVCATVVHRLICLSRLKIDQTMKKEQQKPSNKLGKNYSWFLHLIW